LEHISEDAEVGAAIARFKQPVAELGAILPSIIHGSQRARFEAAMEELQRSGVSPEEAQRIAALRFLGELMAVTQIADEVGREVTDVGRAYCALADQVDFAVLREMLEMAPGEDEWEQRAAQGLLQDLGQARRNLTLAVLMTDWPEVSVEEQLTSFGKRNESRLAALRETSASVLGEDSIGLAALTVATREIVRQSVAILENNL
jgi:glutamate dehydrogenase